MIKSILRPLTRAEFSPIVRNTNCMRARSTRSHASQESTRATAGSACRSSARLTNLKDHRVSQDGDMCLIHGWRDDGAPANATTKDVEEIEEVKGPWTWRYREYSTRSNLNVLYLIRSYCGRERRGIEKKIPYESSVCSTTMIYKVSRIGMGKYFQIVYLQVYLINCYYWKISKMCTK